ncbi:MAG: Mur ligase family protein [bacterium]
MADPRHCGWYLKRLNFFLNLIGNPEKKIKRFAHITGTSGKGSVCNMLTSILMASNCKVGLLTSPHPSIIVERWGINGRPMPKKEFAKVMEKIKPKLNEYIRTTPYDMLSYGEMSTAIALYYFAMQKVDWAVLEVGCGGRYDSTNIIPKKELAVITNIGLDHKGTIGATKNEIAYEKAGIIKRGCVAFTGESNSKILEIIANECRRQKVKLSKINCSTKNYKIKKFDLDGMKFIYQNNEYFLPIMGEHQIKNAILSIEIAKSLKISENEIKQGLKNIKIPICMEVVSKKPLIIFDGAHNKEKIKTTISTVNRINLAGNYMINLIVGFSDNKDWFGMIRQLGALNPKSIACTRFTNNPFRKTANPKLIADQFKKILPKAEIQIFLDPKKALNWSKKQNEGNGLLLTTGSIFLSGEIRNNYTECRP